MNRVVFYKDVPRETLIKMCVAKQEKIIEKDKKIQELIGQFRLLQIQLDSYKKIYGGKNALRNKNNRKTQ